MKTSEVLKRYAQGERNFRSVNLRGQSFKGLNLKQADFSEADLRSTNFTAANLGEANFTGAKCGLQRRWIVLLTIISWLIASISGFLSILSVNLISRIFDSSSQDTQLAGWISLIILVISLVLTFCWGAREGAIAVALPAIGTIILAVVAGVLGGVVTELAEVSLRIIAVAAVGAFSVAQAIATGIVVALAVAVGGIVGGIVGGTIAAALAILVSVFISALVTSATEIATILTTVVSTVFVCVGWRTWKGDRKDAWLRSLAIAFAAMGGTSFRDADLTEANFTEAKLKSTDFRKAILTRTLWRDAQRIDFVRPGKTYLNISPLRHLLVTGAGQGKDFNRQDLRGVNLSKANLENASFIDTDFYQANLQKANLSRTILVRTNFERADLSNADLTGKRHH